MIRVVTVRVGGVTAPAPSADRAEPTGATRAPEPRGRPRIRQDAEILEAALRSFAAHGYDGMSVRSLNAELGLSHGTVSQRFRSKEQLWFAAIDHGFATFRAEIDRERSAPPAPTDDLDALRRAVRAFLRAAARRPELGRLMNQEGLERTPRLDHIVATVLVPAFDDLGDLVARLVRTGTIRPVTARSLFFLVAHGAEAPFTLTALSGAFDVLDGPLDGDAHVDAVTDLIVRGLRPD